MLNPVFDISFADVHVWSIELRSMLQDDPITTTSDRGVIVVRDFAPGSEDLYSLFRDAFLKSTGLYFFPVKGGYSDFNELVFLLDKIKLERLSNLSYTVRNSPKIKTDYVPLGWGVH